MVKIIVTLSEQEYVALEGLSAAERRGVREQAGQIIVDGLQMLELLPGKPALRQCPICGRAFSRNYVRQRYCSPRCRKTAQQRAYRSRKAALDNP